MTTYAVEQGWIPHHPETWKFRFATLLNPVEMRHYTQKWVGNEPQFDTVPCPAGTRVKIVMVSRFGDIGITEKLDAEHGYAARVHLDDLCDFGNEP